MNRLNKENIAVSADWQKFLDGDREALGNIFHRYFSDLVDYGRKIVAVDDFVKDHIQELFVHLWEKRSNLGGVRNVKVYLLICLKNDLLQTIRSGRHDSADLTDQDGQFVVSSEDFIIEKEHENELAGKMAACLEKLTIRQREVIYLRFYMNLDFQHLSEVMGMNVQSVRNLLFRTLERIRREIDDSNIQQAGNIELFLFNLFARNRNFV